MAEVLFNNKGIPLMASGRTFMADTSGAPAYDPKTITHVSPDLDETVSVGNNKVVAWGSGNNFPQEAEKLIGKTGVLNTGLKFIHRFTIGQGIFPCRVTGYDADGNEQLEVVNDEKITAFINDRKVRRYLHNAARDYFKFGSAFPELIPSADAKQLVGIDVKNALYARYLEKKNGIIPGVVVSGKWPDSPSERKDYSVVPLLDNYDPYADLERYRLLNKLSGQTFIYPLRDEWSNNEYHPLPIWWSAKLAGWIDIANKVPSFLIKMYENQITLKWHVQIPYAYWEKKYPEKDFKSVKERKDAIQKEMDTIEESLTGTENANKALFSMFEMNPNGKVEEQWIITALDDKTKANDQLITSAAANSEICFALMINPNVFGAGMPGGTYAGNQGGSNIREAFLVNVALAWLDRQTLLDPLEMILQYNGWTNVQLRFRNTLLTTLDTGAGTTKTLS
ncbi:hypothetical protein E9993_14650 [Labilibacter sediminis]|nr:hypothetical protein E9993_14650 [Labilibacter sediminis]